MSETATATRSRLARSFTRKKLAVTFTVARNGLSPGSTSDEVRLEGYRCQVDVTNVGMRLGQACGLRIYGLALPLMNRLSMLPFRIAAQDSYSIRTNYNTVMVEAGDDETGLSTVYYGIISEAFADFMSAPEPAFQVTSHSVQAPNTTIVPAQSYPEGTALASILSNIAAVAGYTFVNYGVNVRLPRAMYLHGTLSDQVEQLSAAFKFIYNIRTGAVDTGNTTTSGADQSPRYEITIWSQNLSDLVQKTMPKISARTGLIGYPTYNSSGVSFTTEFDRRIQFMEPVEIDSQYLPEAWVNNHGGQVAPMPANGAWMPITVSHQLDSEIPQGRWFTTVDAIRADQVGKQRAT